MLGCVLGRHWRLAAWLLAWAVVVVVCVLLHELLEDEHDLAIRDFGRGRNEERLRRKVKKHERAGRSSYECRLPPTGSRERRLGDQRRPPPPVREVVKRETNQL